MSRRYFKLLAAARYDQVDEVALLDELLELAPVGGEVRDRGTREALLDECTLHRLRENAVGVRGGAAAAEDRRITGLKAETGGVDRHPGPRLVHDGDNPEGNAHLAELDAVVEVPAVFDLADGIGQGGQRAHPRRDVAQPILVQKKAVDEGV